MADRDYDNPDLPDPDDIAGDGQQHDELPTWHRLPERERAAFVLSECAAGRWLSLVRQPVDEEVLAVMAAVDACMSDDRMDDLVHVVRGHDKDALLVTAIKIIGEMIQDQHLSLDFTRVWASYAVERSG